MMRLPRSRNGEQSRVPKKTISYDYLYSRRDAFPFAYRVVFEKILSDAPAEEDRYWQGYNDGYENGKLDAEAVRVKTNMYDQEEVHNNCTVQVLTNSVTGEVSVGWWDNDNPPAGVEDEI